MMLTKIHMRSIKTRLNYMKIYLSILLLLAILLSSNSANVATAATKPVLTARETAIAKTYVKAYESGNSSAISKYIYPKAKIKFDAVPDTTKVKVFSPIYSKKYDTKTKMNYILVSGVIVSSNGTDLTVLKGTLGFNLKTKSKTVYAYSTNTANTKLTEILADDLTKAQTDKIQTYLTGIYDATTASKMLFGGPKVSIATHDTPVPLGSTYTYNNAHVVNGHELSGTFNITVNEVTDLTEADLKNIGYMKSNFEETNAEYFKYKRVNVTWAVKDAKIVKLVKTGKNYVSKYEIRPLFEGTAFANDSKEYLGYVTLDGFNGSLQDNLNEKYKEDALELNATTNLIITGDIIFPVSNNTENYMRIETTGTPKNRQYIYFKLQK